MWKVMERSDRPLVAWLFNTEGLNSAIKRAVARLPLDRVDRFVVHSTAEIEGYADLLRLPVERRGARPQRGLPDRRRAAQHG